MVPTGLDVLPFDAQKPLGEFSFFAVGNVDDARGWVNAAQGDGEGPAQNKIPECSDVEDQDVAAHLKSPLDPAAAEDHIVVVEHNSLAGGDGGLGLVEIDAHL